MTKADRKIAKAFILDLRKSRRALVGMSASRKPTISGYINLDAFRCITLNVYGIQGTPDFGSVHIEYLNMQLTVRSCPHDSEPDKKLFEPLARLYFRER